MSRIKSMFKIFLVLLFVALVALALYMPNIKRIIFVHWLNQFEQGDDNGAIKTEILVRLIDSDGRAVIDYDRSIIANMRQTDGWEKRVAQALSELNRQNPNEWSHAIREDWLIKRSSLNALLGNIELAKSQADSYCDNLRPHQSSYDKCFEYILKFRSYDLSRENAIRVYAWAKAGDAIGLKNKGILYFYEYIGLNVFDKNNANRLRDKMKLDGQFDEKMLSDFCRDAQIFSTICN